MIFCKGLFVPTLVLLLLHQNVLGGLIKNQRYDTTCIITTSVNRTYLGDRISLSMNSWQSVSDTEKTFRAQQLQYKLAMFLPEISSCMKRADLDNLYKSVVETYPRGILPPLTHGTPSTFSDPMTAPAESRLESQPVLHLSKRISMIVNGVDLGPCAAVPSSLNTTTAFPPCANVICITLGQPSAWAGEMMSCTSGYNLGSLQYVYTWYYPSATCSGTDCHKIGM